MTNAGFVSQLVVPGVGAMAGRSEQAGRKTEEGEFSDLLSKFAGGKEQTALGDQSSEGEAERPQADRPLGERQKVLSWLAGNAEAWQAERAVGSGDAEQDITPSTIVGVLAQAVELLPAAAPAGVPKATASQAPGARVPLPADMAGGQPVMPNDETLEPQPPLEVTADITVLKKEAHLAPRSAASGSLAEWAAGMLGAGKGRVAGPAPQSAMPIAEPDVALSTGLPAEEKPQGVSSVAVSPSRAAYPGPGMKHGESPVPVPVHSRVARETLAAVEAEPIAMRMAPTGGSEQVPTPVQLIASRVLQEAPGAAPSAGTAARAATSQQPLMPPAKVLHIQLQPAEMGTVTLRMSLKDRTLRLEVEVGNAETGRMIQKDREALSSLLRSAGYLVDGLDVRIADSANAGTPTGSGQSATQMQGGGQSQADARSPDAHSREGSPRHHSGDKGRNTHDQAVEADRSGGIFV